MDRPVKEKEDLATSTFLFRENNRFSFVDSLWCLVHL